MKTYILCSAALVLALTGISGAAGTENGHRNRFAEYVAGVELILGDKNLSPVEQARRYRSLCEITGVNGGKAKAFVEQYRSDPAGWQTFEAMVLKLLQKKG
jgi:hypothetical protein